MATREVDTTTWPAIPQDEMKDFMVRCMEKVGSKREHAQMLAEVLVSADSRGTYSHGVNKLDMYVKDIQAGITSTNEPEILKETPATAWVDGKNALGPVVGRVCMDLAIKKAKDIGVGWVVAKGSCHFGTAGWYALRAAKEGLVGMAYTNTSPRLVPTRSRSHGLGTNPIAVAANGTNDDSFELDMATTSVAQGKLEIALRRGEQIPEGWGCFLDEKGKPTSDATVVIKGGGCPPLGGMEETGGYKGYGLAMMVEVLCGILGGAEFGPNIKKYRTRERVANLGQCFVAVNPDCFAPGFDERLTALTTSMRNLELAEGETEILVPGDPERKHMRICKERGGIPYHPGQIKYITDLAEELKVDAPPSIKQQTKK